MKKPNILLIHADQLRADCLGASGNKDVLTPNIDRLAGDGVAYTQHFCPFPVCTPSRYSLLSGLYVHQHMGSTNHCTLPSGLATFPRILKERGYSTKAVGKMHFTPTYLDVGFEEMILAEQDGPGRHDDDYHRYLRGKGLIDRIDLMDQVAEYRKDAPPDYWKTFGAMETNLGEEDYSTSWIAGRAMDDIRKWDATGGHMLMVGFIKPHHPFDPPRPWSEMYRPGELEMLPGWIEQPLRADLDYSEGYFLHRDLTEGIVRRVMSMYYASISQIDAQVGKMIEMLKAKRLYDDTVIIFTSDHGDYMGFHHLLMKANRMYDPVMRIPLIIKYPGQTRKGTQTGMLTCNIDIAPTVLDLAGAPRGLHMRGKNLAEGEGHARLFAQNYGCDEYMVRSGEYKLLLHRTTDKSMFFDLANDPLEMNNLYGSPQYAGLIDAYRKALEDWILFQCPAVDHLDERAPVIDGGKTAGREESEAYFREKMGKKG